MDEGLKNKAYLEGQKLKKAGYDDEVILARLDKQGIPEHLAKQVVKNLNIQRHVEIVKEETPVYNAELIKIGLGIGLAIVSAIIFPGHIIIPAGLILGGIVFAIISKNKMKG
ncbi:hypothetical protein EWM62_11135 [Mucilaginibacter terrigena]|uniref:Uncharacterized protein n=1 Tax=Mucilaginibacter terrigena TaxID=2492395 RepID=A0A4Q5LKH4_9SPHI|nr:hypothetical protein [Mucilaginibacter terrigena]RYU90088.1 hypothetical protein EWM62_11135 [Mucilaginibacter terrigena]